MSAYQRGRDDAFNHEYNPPGDVLMEFVDLDGTVHDHYSKERAKYEQGRDDMKNEMEHGGRK